MSRLLLASQVVGLFFVTGLCEIGGGYLIWGTLRDRRPGWWAAAGAVLLILYGVIAARQPATFGRAYAAYGGVFVALSVAWGWGVDGVRPDRFDLIGSAVCLIGVAIIAFAPRG